jgi:ABC-type transporter Mla subunit MlaD
VREESSRQLQEFVEKLGEIGRTTQEFQRELLETHETNARTLTDSAQRLATTLQRVDEQTERALQANASQMAAGAEQLETFARSREQARRDEAELRDAHLSALRTASEDLTRTLRALHTDAHAAHAEIGETLDGLAPELLQRLETLAGEFAAPWKRQLAQLERIQERLEQSATGGDDEDAGGPPAGSRLRRLLRKT